MLAVLSADIIVKPSQKVHNKQNGTATSFVFLKRTCLYTVLYEIILTF